MVHKFGRNLTLLHSGGAYKSAGGYLGETGMHFLGWKSITVDNDPINNETCFTDSKDRQQGMILCDGVNNTAPYQSHNSVGKLSSQRFNASNNVIMYTDFRNLIIDKR